MCVGRAGNDNCIPVTYLFSSIFIPPFLIPEHGRVIQLVKCYYIMLIKALLCLVPVPSAFLQPGFYLSQLIQAMPASPRCVWLTVHATTEFDPHLLSLCQPHICFLFLDLPAQHIIVRKSSGRNRTRFLSAPFPFPSLSPSRHFSPITYSVATFHVWRFPDQKKQSWSPLNCGILLNLILYLKLFLWPIMLWIYMGEELGHLLWDYSNVL